jgi:MoxR-like ATPase
MLRVSLGYPSQEEEAAMLDRFHENPNPALLEPVVEPDAITAAQTLVDEVQVDPTVRDYVLAIVKTTRTHEQLRLGASPRASLTLQRAAQANAAMAGRDYVIPDDVKALAGPVLSHRIIGDMSAQLRGITRARIVADIVTDTPVPIER